MSVDAYTDVMKLATTKQLRNITHWLMHKLFKDITRRWLENNADEAIPNNVSIFTLSLEMTPTLDWPDLLNLLMITLVQLENATNSAHNALFRELAVSMKVLFETSFFDRVDEAGTPTLSKLSVMCENGKIDETAELKNELKLRYPELREKAKTLYDIDEPADMMMPESFDRQQFAISSHLLKNRALVNLGEVFTKTINVWSKQYPDEELPAPIPPIVENLEALLDKVNNSPTVIKIAKWHQFQQIMAKLLRLTISDYVVNEASKQLFRCLMARIHNVYVEIYGDQIDGVELQTLIHVCEVGLLLSSDTAEKIKLGNKVVSLHFYTIHGFSKELWCMDKRKQQLSKMVFTVLDTFEKQLGSPIPMFIRTFVDIALSDPIYYIPYHIKEVEHHLIRALKRFSDDKPGEQEHDQVKRQSVLLEMCEKLKWLVENGDIKLIDISLFDIQDIIIDVKIVEDGRMNIVDPQEEEESKSRVNLLVNFIAMHRGVCDAFLRKFESHLPITFDKVMILFNKMNNVRKCSDSTFRNIRNYVVYSIIPRGRAIHDSHMSEEQVMQEKYLSRELMKNVYNYMLAYCPEQIDEITKIKKDLDNLIKKCQNHDEIEDFQFTWIH